MITKAEDLRQEILATTSDQGAARELYGHVIDYIPPQFALVEWLRFLLRDELLSREQFYQFRDKAAELV